MNRQSLTQKPKIRENHQPYESKLSVSSKKSDHHWTSSNRDYGGLIFDELNHDDEPPLIEEAPKNQKSFQNPVVLAVHPCSSQLQDISLVISLEKHLFLGFYF